MQTQYNMLAAHHTHIDPAQRPVHLRLLPACLLFRLLLLWLAVFLLPQANQQRPRPQTYAPRATCVNNPTPPPHTQKAHAHK